MWKPWFLFWQDQIWALGWSRGNFKRGHWKNIIPLSCLKVKIQWVSCQPCPHGSLGGSALLVAPSPHVSAGPYSTLTLPKPCLAAWVSDTEVWPLAWASVWCWAPGDIPRGIFSHVCCFLIRMISMNNQWPHWDWSLWFSTCPKPLPGLLSHSDFLSQIS